MPSDAFCWARAARALWRLESETISTNPSPNAGGGMRKMTLFSASAAAKFGCAKTQPGIRASLDREEIVHAAIGRPVWIEDKARLADRTIRGHEGRDHVG